MNLQLKLKLRFLIDENYTNYPLMSIKFVFIKEPSRAQVAHKISLHGWVVGHLMGLQRARIIVGQSTGLANVRFQHEFKVR